MRLSVKLFDGEEKRTKTSEALRHINEATSKVRSRFITDIEGQHVVYMMKAEEAKRYLEADAPDLANFPLVAAEAGITAPTAEETASVYLHMSDRFVMTLALVESIRLTAVVSIENAAERGAIDAAVNAFDASISALPF